MLPTLLVVESPTKAKTIGKYLGKEFTVLPTVGHLRDLPKSKMGVDPENNFQVDYVVDPVKKKVLNDLLGAAKKSSLIMLATDPDREGEAISWHVSELIKDPKNKVKSEIKRVVFHEITKTAIEKAIKEPREIDQNLVDAQQARRVLDRLVGYKLSPVLWKKVRRGLSAGRVQSVALRLICQREEEINKFAKKKYFSLWLEVEKEGKKFEAWPLTLAGEKYEIKTKLELFDGDYVYGSTIIDTEEKLENIKKQISKELEVSKVEEKEIKRSPLPPFTTSKLQQAAASKFGWSGKMTMSYAQKLYEKGWISYHRTDSVYLAPEAVEAMRKHIVSTWGKEYVADKPRFFANKSKNAQEAHEAIRPTKMDRVVSHLKDQREQKLYEMIYKRALASQASQARLEKTIVELKDENNTFRAEGVRMVFEGYLKIYGHILEEQILPKIAEGEKLSWSEIKSEEEETNAPPRYSDASLVGALERQGIGRPSTYAPIISTIQVRGYVERVEGKFVPSVVGMAVSTFLVKNFEEIVSLPFTAEMELSLDKVALGRLAWKEMMKKFWGGFEKEVARVEKDSERVKIEVEKLNKPCPDCKEGELVIRTGRFGKFISCSRFPECKHTEALKIEADFLCPTCGAKVVIRRSKKGRKFFGCSTYPTCKWAGWKKP